MTFDVNLNLDAATYRSLQCSWADEDAGMRVDLYLAKHFPFLTRSKWQDKIESGEVLVCGRQVKTSHKVRPTDVFEYFYPQQVEPEVDRGIFPIFKSGAVMAVYKPSGLPMHENGPYRFNTFANLLRDLFGDDWSAVHRLDRETSGIVLCSKNADVRAQLADDFARGRIGKEYIAYCRGHEERDSFVEHGPIGDLAESSIRIKKWVHPDGLPSTTCFNVLERKDGFVKVLARPLTGRTNQIRIHAAFNHLPLVGDKLYHDDERVFNEYFDHRGNTDWIVEQTGFHRLCLHAHRLRFVLPQDGKDINIECPVPDDMVSFWEGL